MVGSRRDGTRYGPVGSLAQARPTALPPARTRRIVGNVEITPRDDGTLAVLSAFHLFYARPGLASFLYAGQRRDVLRRTEDGLRILRREIVMDLADIEYPTLGLFL